MDGLVKINTTDKARFHGMIGILCSFCDRCHRGSGWKPQNRGEDEIQSELFRFIESDLFRSIEIRTGIFSSRGFRESVMDSMPARQQTILIRKGFHW